MELREFSSYEQFKQEFDREVRAHVQGYIRMGYLLRRATDTGIIRQSQYKSVAEFAWAEYHLKPDAVSKMMAVNERYSEGGYSERVAERYSGFGSSLLAEMLTLPEPVVNALPDTVTREVIRDVKREMKEEESITPMEVLAEETEPGQQAMETTLSKFLYQYYRENRECYRELHDYVLSCPERMDGHSEDGSREFTQNHLAPSGTGVKMVRIAGMGRFMLAIKGTDQPMELLNIRSGESEQISWAEAYEAMRSLCRGKDAKKDWEGWYGEPFEVSSEPGKAETEETEKKGESNSAKDPVKTGADTIFAPAQKNGDEGEKEKRPDEVAEMQGAVPEASKDEPEASEERSETLEELPETPEENQEVSEETPELQEEETEVPETVLESPEEASEEPLTTPEETPRTLVEMPETPVEVAETEPHQIAIDEMPEVLPPGYIKNGGGAEDELRVEERIWKEAAEKAERLFNTLSGNRWDADAGKIIGMMVDESEELCRLLEELVSMMDPS